MRGEAARRQHPLLPPSRRRWHSPQGTSLQWAWLPPLLQVGDRYDLLKVLGYGSYSAVVLALDKTTGEKVCTGNATCLLTDCLDERAGQLGQLAEGCGMAWHGLQLSPQASSAAWLLAGAADAPS